MMASRSFVFRFDDVEVREREFVLLKSGNPLSLEPKAFRVLLFLLHNPQKLISKEELLNSIWPDVEVTEGSLTRCIWLLRRLLGDESQNPRFIETVPTVGYRFVCRVNVSEDESGDSGRREMYRSLGEDGTDTAVATTLDPAEPGPSSEAVGVLGEITIPKPDEEKHRSSRGWVFISIAGLAVGLTATVMYFYRPLPSLHISQYVRITNDGGTKFLRATDGTRLFFNKLQQEEIAQVATSGGLIAPVPVEVELPWLEDVSPDGSTLLIASDINAGSTLSVHPLWTVGILGGSRRHIADAIAATWSPDGKFVAYSTGDGEISRVRSDGTGASRLAFVGDKVTFLRWSPDGSSIRFVIGNKLWEISSDGSNLHRLLPDWPAASVMCCGRWSPDGNYFFVSDGQIWFLSEHHRFLRRQAIQPVRLTSDPLHWDMPIPSRDGTTLFASGARSRGELVRFDPISGTYRPFLSGISAEFVSFSNDGKSVAYVSYPDGILWRANADGSNPLQLTDPPMYPRSPRWSPDGTQIIFMGQLNTGARLEIFVVPSVGGSVQRLFPEDAQAKTYPSYSPDGSEVAFSTSQENGRDQQSEIRILNLATHQVRTLPGSVGVFDPHWAPNGRFLFGVSFERSNLKVLDFATHRWSTIHAGLVGSPKWSSDSRSIYFVDWQSDPAIFRVNTNGAAPERVIDLSGFHYTGYYNLWMGLDHSDAPLMLRDISTNDVYALSLEKK